MQDHMAPRNCKAVDTSTGGIRMSKRFMILTFAADDQLVTINMNHIAYVHTAKTFKTQFKNANTVIVMSNGTELLIKEKCDDVRYILTGAE
jgi:uncharacterized protein YlzI (FlbEa/FlbD family)